MNMNLPLTDDHLRQHSPAIDMDANTFRDIGHRLIEDIADFLCRDVDEVRAKSAELAE